MSSVQDGNSKGDGSQGDGRSGIFQGMSFWLSHNVPQRSRFKELVQVSLQSSFSELTDIS